MRQSRPLKLVLAALAIAVVHAAPAVASSNQQSILEDDGQLHSNPVATLNTLRAIGVDTVRVTVNWSSITPTPLATNAPAGFNGANPSSYPASGWAPYDAIVRDAKTEGIGVLFSVTGPAPRWAEGSPIPSGGPFGVWKPSPSAYGAFVRAVGTRYSGHYTPSGASSPLPAVTFWSIWNEPNYGQDLAPQAIDHDTIEVGAVAYRALLNAAWTGLHATGHGHNTILIGETAPRGLNHPIGNFSGTKPLRFLRALYCVNSSYKELRGKQASERSCPTTAAGSKKFRAQNPALFQASGFADHPYEQGVAPNTPTYGCGFNICTTKNHKSDPDYADLPEIPRLEGVLDKLNKTYGSHTKFPIYSTEYGYRVNPPDPEAKIGQATAELYMNWAEYLSWRQPRLVSYDQYELIDSAAGVFASGLELANGTLLPTYSAFRMPLFLPVTTAKPGHSLEVWGCLRPASVARQETGRQQSVLLQFQRGSTGAFTTISTIRISSSRGYFDIHQQFPASGTVRLQWTEPDGQVDDSRTVAVKVP
jgi:hypothetical protein